MNLVALICGLVAGFAIISRVGKKKEVAPGNEVREPWEILDPYFHLEHEYEPEAQEW